MNMPMLNGLAFSKAYMNMPLAHQQAIVIVLLTTSLHPLDLARVKQLPIAGFPCTSSPHWPSRSGI
jgi:hypothetical protein